MVKRTCSVDGCKRPARSNQADWCNTHYFRWYRTGDVGEAEIAPYRRGPRPCAVQECETVIPNGTYCAKHQARLDRNGNPLALKPNPPSGPRNGWWKGDDIGYGAAHDRIRRSRGPADHCVLCHTKKGPYEWALNKDSPRVRICDTTDLPFSPDPNDYASLCASCHRTYDLMKRPCIDCGAVASTSRCERCQKVANRRRYERRAHYRGDYSKRRAELLEAKPEGPCWLCGELIVDPAEWSADHVIPGHPGSPLEPAHLECNVRRGSGGRPKSSQSAAIR